MKYAIFALVTLSSLLSSGEQQIFVTTGYNDDGSLADSELITVGGNGGCGKPADYPSYIRGTIGGLVNGKMTVCGGGYFLVYSGDCFQYQPDTNEWTEFPALSEIRSGAASVNGPEGLWAAGGYEGGPLKNTSEVFNEAIEAWVPGPLLPNPLYDHCMVQLNSTHTAVIGGYSTMERTLAETWIYNWASQTWSQQPDMRVPRDDHYCALLPDGNILVAGGVTTDNAYTDTVEIFDMQTLTWSDGPKLPENRWGGKAVTNENGEVVLVAGRISLDFTPTLLKFTGEGWETLTEQLALPRHYTTVFSFDEQTICPQ